MSCAFPGTREPREDSGSFSPWTTDGSMGEAAPQGHEPLPLARRPPSTSLPVLERAGAINPSGFRYPPGAVPHHPGKGTIRGGLTHQQACRDRRCRDRHPPRFPPALPCPAQATAEKEKAMGLETLRAPSPVEMEGPLARTPAVPPCRWALGRVEKAPDPAKPIPAGGTP